MWSQDYPFYVWSRDKSQRLAALLSGWTPFPPKKKETPNMTLSMFCFVLFHLLQNMRPAFKSGMYTYLDLVDLFYLLSLSMLGPYLAYPLCSKMLESLLFQEVLVFFFFHTLWIFLKRFMRWEKEFDREISFRAGLYILCTVSSIGSLCLFSYTTGGGPFSMAEQNTDYENSKMSLQTIIMLNIFIRRVVLAFPLDFSPI